MNFMRFIVFPFQHFDGIRTYTICPSGIEKKLMTPDEQAAILESVWTLMTKVRGIIEMLVNGGTVEDSWGKKIEKESNYGFTVEINNDKHSFRDQIDYCDELMKTNLYNTSLEFVTKNS